MRLTSLSKPIFFIAASVMVSACDFPGGTGISNLQHPRPTLQSQQGGLQNAQSIFAERTAENDPSYFAPKLKAIGFASVAVQPSKNLNQRRLLAIRAAKLDAYRVLAEQIHGVQLDSETTVAEAILTSDILSSAVRGTVMGAETVKIEPTDADTYLVELSVSQTHVDRLIKLYKWGQL
tara:strand:+ start:163 stop:696 length:534 start_codon:yes stop_codon:yes gene_type:complete